MLPMQGLAMQSDISVNLFTFIILPNVYNFTLTKVCRLS